MENLKMCNDGLRAASQQFFQEVDLDMVRMVQKEIQSRRNSGTIYFSGIGKSANLGHHISDMLKSIGFKANDLDPVLALHGDSGMVRDSDLLMCFSKSGNTEEVATLVRTLQARESRCATVAVVCNPKCTLRRLCDKTIVLPTHPEVDPGWNLVPTVSSSYFMHLGNLWVAGILNEEKYSIKSYGESHPGGKIGSASRSMSDGRTVIRHEGEDTSAPKIASGVKLPEPVRATDGLKEGASLEDVFAMDTISKRVPKIADSMGAFDWPLEVKAEIAQLAEEIRKDAPLRLIEDLPRCNAEYWNDAIESLPVDGRTWMSAEVWLTENYFYKRVLEIFEKAGLTADPFGPQKAKQLEAVSDALPGMLEELKDYSIATWLMRSLWGNVADLSLSAGQKVGNVAINGVVVDETERIVKQIEQTNHVGLVTDNAGLEVVSDLLLIDRLVRAGKKVTLLAKDSPVFVSDVTVNDVYASLDWMEERALLADEAKNLRKNLGSKFIVADHPFFTTAKPLWEMPADLEKKIKGMGVVIFKGDANYRRMLGDRKWTAYTSLATILHPWAPTNLVALRTMKFSVVAGLPVGSIEEMKAVDPNWMVSGKWGVIQMVPKAPAPSQEVVAPQPTTSPVLLANETVVSEPGVVVKPVQRASVEMRGDEDNILI